MKDDGIGIEFFKILMNAVDQLLLAGHTDSSQHAASHLAKLNLDQIQPRAVLGREHKDEALWHGLQVTSGPLEICAEWLSNTKRIPPLHVVSNLVWPKLTLAEDLVEFGTTQLLQCRMAGGDAVLTHMGIQQFAGPQFVGITQFLGLLASTMLTQAIASSGSCRGLPERGSRRAPPPRQIPNTSECTALLYFG